MSILTQTRFIIGTGRIGLRALAVAVLWLAQAGLIAQTASTPTVQFPTIADMVAARIPATANRLTALVTGRTSTNDGGGGVFFYDSASAASTNLGTIFKPAASNGRWLRQYSGALNVKWFGAIGDGVTDDTISIQAAIDAASLLGGGEVLAPVNTYAINGSQNVSPVVHGVEVKSNVSLTLENGAVFQAITDADQNYAVLLLRGTNIRLSGGIISGDRDNHPAVGQFGHAVYVYAATNVIVFNTILQKGIGDGALVRGNSAEILFSGTAFKNNRRMGCAVTYAKKVSFANCLFLSNGDVGTGGSGLDLERDDAASPVREISVIGCVSTGNAASGININVADDVAISGCVLESNADGLLSSGGLRISAAGNTIKDNSTRGVYIYSASDNVTITGNIIYSNGSDGVYVLSSTLVDCTANEISENSNYGIHYESSTGVIGECIINATSGVGIRVRASSGGVTVTGCLSDSNTSYGLEINASSNVPITGNTIKSNGLDGVIFQGGSSRATVTGNAIHSNQRHGILLTSTASNIAISNNSIYNNGLVTDNTYDGINIDGGSDDVTIQGNVIKHSGGANQQRFGVNIVVNTCDRALITGNSLTNSGRAGPLSNSGTGTIIRYNTGFITESNGTATIAAGTTSSVVAHGLSTTPALKNIRVVPTNDLGAATKFWISTPTSSQFTVNVDVDPGASTATFAWDATTP